MVVLSVSDVFRDFSGFVIYLLLADGISPVGFLFMRIFRAKITDLIDEYCDHALLVEQKSLQTIQTYRYAIMRFVRAIGDKRVSRITLADFDVMKVFLRGNGNSRRHIASITFAMKSFLRYCESRGERVIDVSAIRSPKQVKRDNIVRVLSSDEIRAIIDSIAQKETNPISARWVCLLECLWSSGMRISEALSLNIHDIDLKNGEATVYGKGGVCRKVFFSHRAVAAIQLYLSLRSDNHPALFVTHTKTRRWTSMSAHHYMTVWRKENTSVQYFTFHDLRRSFATYIHTKTSNIYATSKFLGHKKIDTTQKYYIHDNWDMLRDLHHDVFNNY